MKKDIRLSDGDKVTTYEISQTFYLIINQTHNFQFEKLFLAPKDIYQHYDLVKLHYQYLKLLSKNDPKMMDLELEEDMNCLGTGTTPNIKKCLRGGYDVALPDLRKKRTI